MSQMSARKDASSPPFHIEISELTNERIKFVLTNCDQSVANALRRIMMAEVPTLAIETVTVNENTSVLFDEFLAHRLGLLPINSRNVDKYEYQRECSCSYSCPNCTVKYTLDVVATDPGITEVTHHDIQSTDTTTSSTTAEGTGFPFPVPLWDREASNEDNRSKGIVLVKLRQNQQVSMKLEAKKGIGKIHAKFNPTGTVSMRYHPVIEVDREIEFDVPVHERKEIIASCPRKVFELDSTQHIEVVRPDECIMCEECLNKSNIDLNRKGLLSVNQRNDKVYFDVESTGARPPKDIVSAAIRILTDKWATLGKDLEDWEQQFVHA